MILRWPFCDRNIRTNFTSGKNLLIKCIIIDERCATFPGDCHHDVAEVTSHTSKPPPLIYSTSVDLEVPCPLVLSSPLSPEAFRAARGKQNYSQHHGQYRRCEGQINNGF